MRDRQLPCQRRRTGRYNRRIATGWVGRDGNNQAACLIVPAAVGQLFFRCIHDAVQVTGITRITGLCRASRGADAQKLQQLADVELVLRANAGNKIRPGKQFVGFKIRSAGVQSVGMLMIPWTGDIMLA